MSEAGIKDYEVLNWFGLFAPAGTPQPIVDRLQSEAAAMFADPETNRRLAGEGTEPVASKPADFAVFVRAEIKKWDEVGKAANIVPTERQGSLSLRVENRHRDAACDGVDARVLALLFLLA